MTPISPQVTIKIPDGNCCQQVNCCSSGNTTTRTDARIVVRKDSELSVEESGCWNRMFLCMKRLFCCKEKPRDVEAENERVAQLLEMYIRQQHGPVAASVAQKILEEKRTSGTRESDLERLEKISREIESQQAYLEALFKQAKFYLTSIQESDSKSEQDMTSPSDIAIDFSLDRMKVKQLDGSFTIFDESKMKERIKAIVKSIDEDVLHEIVENVKAHLTRRGDMEVSSEEIRKCVVEELKLKGISIDRPVFLDHLRDTRGILSCRNIADLAPEELLAIYSSATESPPATV